MTQYSATATEHHASHTGAWEGAFKAIGQVFTQVRQNPEPALVVLGTYLALTVLSYIVMGAPSNDSGGFRFEDLGTLIFLLAMPTYVLALADKKKLSISDFMQFNGSKYFTVLGVTILYALIVAGSALLLIVPAIWTVAWFFVSTLVAVDKGLGVIESLKASKQLTESHKGKVWGILGACLLLILVTIPIQLTIPFIGELVSAFAGILIGGAGAVLYRWLEHQKAA